MRRRLLLAAALVPVLVGCRGGDDDPAAPAADAPTTAATGAAPTFTGDPDSELCRRLRTGTAFLDPFAAGLDAGERDQRLGTLIDTFTELEALAPPEIAADLTTIKDGLVELRAGVTGLGRSGEDGSGSPGELDPAVIEDAVESTAYVDASARVFAYREQVCR